MVVFVYTAYQRSQRYDQAYQTKIASMVLSSVRRVLVWYKMEVQQL